MMSYPLIARPQHRSRDEHPPHHKHDPGMRLHQRLIQARVHGAQCALVLKACNHGRSTSVSLDSFRVGNVAVCEYHVLRDTCKISAGTEGNMAAKGCGMQGKRGGGQKGVKGKRETGIP